MTNYLLSIDPSIKNTGFTLWEDKKPIWINSYDFKRYTNISDCLGKKCTCEWKLKIISHISDRINYLDNLYLIIERGTFHSKNGIGYETQEHLRGFIAGQFNKLITKDMLISPSEWKKWYVKDINNKNKIWPFYSEFLSKINKEKWNKELSINLSKLLIKTNNWNITISNHDEADSLLIGWYYLNKEK